MSFKNSNLLILISALALGSLTYFYLGYKKSKQITLAANKAVEVIAQETNQRPLSEADLQNRIPASVSQTEYQQHQNNLSAFANSGFTAASPLLLQVNKISMEILKSHLEMEKKSALNAQLHEIASQKLAQLNPPKIVGTRLDLKDNVVYPVFETK